MSRFVTTKSEDARLEAMSDPSSAGDLDENDPQSVSRFMKKMGEEFGDELGDDFGEAVDEAMTESDPEESGSATGGDDSNDL